MRANKSCAALSIDSQCGAKGGEGEVRAGPRSRVAEGQRWTRKVRKDGAETSVENWTGSDDGENKHRKRSTTNAALACRAAAAACPSSYPYGANCAHPGAK